MRTIHPQFAARRRARRRLRHLLPDLGGAPDDPVRERLLDLLRETRPSASVGMVDGGA